MRVVPFVTALALLMVPWTARADSWRCGTRLVSVGDESVSVRARCGDPAFVDRRTQVRSIARKGRKTTQSTQIEEWSYQQGGNELLRTLVFENGRLIAIRVGGYAPTDRSHCERQLFSGGEPTTQVRLVCGEPAAIDEWEEFIEDKHEGTTVGKSIVYEKWVYNFGPERLLRIFEFTNGRLTNQSTGAKGFAEPEATP